MKNRKFAQDFTQIDNVSDNDKILIQDMQNEKNPVKYATQKQVLAPVQEDIDDLEGRVENIENDTMPAEDLQAIINEL